MDETRGTSGTAAGDTGRPDVSRLIAQCAIPHFVRGVATLEHFGGGDPLTGVLALSIIEANVRHIVRDPVLALRYAGVDNPPPDDIRRPISVRALAASFSITYDAARRRVADLEARGLCVRTTRGVYIPAVALETEINRLALARSLKTVEDLAADIRAAAPDFDLTGGAKPIPGFAPATSAERLAARFIAEYVLRFAERLTRTTGDFGRGMILIAILDANYQPLREDLETARRYASSRNPPPDDLLAPISVLALSNQLKQPFETTRRNVNVLIRTKRCVRTPKGIIVPAQAFQTSLAREMLTGNVGDIQRVFGAMARLGVTFD
ncbi:hypothetical protein [Phenylobacterium sp.]|uniref:hypothetical protein n=1 Tax=Phenylobacterium sp. TaxID=1871053 RepID=UPI00272F33B4|nr:hypothetical protein [Phenylobacterium sp.]MDP1617363.1 hypothetical protein [Phenylobacterium sp.]MDP1987589.1 hypothetical protein [Phenylobacterium sp.]